MKIKLKDGDQIFGQVDARDAVVAEVIPFKYAKTYGDKNGICHIDLFGVDTCYGYFWNWRFVKGKVLWYDHPSQIPDEKKNAVDNYLFRSLKVENPIHDSI